MSQLKVLKRKTRHLRIRKKVVGSSEIPRMNVFRSLNHMYVQLIDDVNGKSLVGCSTISKRFKDAVKNDKANKKELSSALGKVVAEMAIEKGIKKVVFDKAGYKYHGRVQAVADGARKAGLKF
jgi:large subunit ribosomal protein L18